MLDTVEYAYGNTNWGDMLTGYGDNTIRNLIFSGNPLSDGTWTYTWEHGRELMRMTGSGKTITFEYNADGLRVSKTVDGVVHNYVYSGGKLVQETYGDTKLDFSYDAYGNPYTFTYSDGTISFVYHYVLNLQGDVVRLVTDDGITVATYAYDAWGNIIDMDYTYKAVADANPLRYRGYYYDSETGLYYLQSRYYNPKWGRFINADSYIATGQGMLGNNMFAYCNNNPVCCIDATGTITDTTVHNSVLAAIILSYQATGYNALSMKNTLIYYNGKNMRNGWGFCDLYDSSTGEVWELKKNSNSYSCKTKNAKKQLGKYVNGRLASRPGLPLHRGSDDLVVGRHTYTIKLEDGICNITYWQECQGILRYSYTFQKNNNRQAEQRIRAACILVGTAIVAVGLLASSGGTAASVIPFVPAFIESIAA